MARPTATKRKTMTSSRTTHAARDTDTDMNDSQFNHVVNNGEQSEDDSQDITATANQMVKLAARLSKKDDWPQAFMKGVNDEQGRLQQKLKGVVNELLDQSAFEKSLIPILRIALAPINLEPKSHAKVEDTIVIEHIGAGTQQYVQDLADLTADCSALIKSYHKLSEEEGSKISRLDRMQQTFKTDQQTAHKAVVAGKHIAATDIDAMLADKFHEVRGLSHTSKEDEELGRVLLSKGVDKPEADSLGWGNVAYRVTRATDRLLQITEEH